MAEDRETGPKSLADKLNRLFATVHPRGRGEYTHEEVAEAIRQRGVASVSHTYIWQLRKGIRTNPSLNMIEALSSFFGVSPSYFFDEAAAARIDAQLDLLDALRDSDVRRLTLRASDLSPESLRTLTEMTERLRELEGLADEPRGDKRIRRRGPRRDSQTGE